MRVHNFSGRRVEVTAGKPFADVVAAFERMVPPQNVSVMGELIAAHADRQKTEEAVNAMVGEFGFMVVAKVDPGLVVSLLGRQKQIKVYLLGNPLVANRMFEHDPAAAAYAPLRAVIYEHHDGTTRFTYDLPSSLLSQFEQDEIRAVAKTLDERLASLGESLAAL